MTDSFSGAVAMYYPFIKAMDKKYYAQETGAESAD